MTSLPAHPPSLNIFNLWDPTFAQWCRFHSYMLEFLVFPISFGKGVAYVLLSIFLPFFAKAFWKCFMSGWYLNCILVPWLRLCQQGQRVQPVRSIHF